MGLFWPRDKVIWRGSRAGAAELLGTRRGEKRSGEVDFWRQSGIYALYSDYKLVYIGQAGMSGKSCIGDRLKHHDRDDLAGRWNMFSWFGLCKVLNTNELAQKANIRQIELGALSNVLEGILIQVAEPPLNKQSGRFGEEVERYLQVDQRGEDEKPLTIKSLRAELTSFKEEINEGN